MVEQNKAMMQLSNGRVVDIVSLMNYEVMEDVWDAKVVAHSLSQITRYTGHTKFPYWVAQHSLLVMQLVGFEHPELMLEALNHDDAEAFTNDMHGGLKHTQQMEYYRNLEYGIQQSINTYHRFPIRDTKGGIHPAIKKADMIARSIEVYNMMDYTADVWTNHFKEYPVIPYVIKQRDSKDVEQEWLNAYWYLVNTNQELRNSLHMRIAIKAKRYKDTMNPTFNGIAFGSENAV